MLASKDPGILDAEFFGYRPTDSREPSEEPRNGSGKAAWVGEYEVVAIPRGIEQLGSFVGAFAHSEVVVVGLAELQQNSLRPDRAIAEPFLLRDDRGVIGDGFPSVLHRFHDSQGALEVHLRILPLLDDRVARQDHHHQGQRCGAENGGLAHDVQLTAC